ncbi:MAG: hypothetical protein DHS80DRAFT_33896 [Piptocephalis tieghemiana]|nr:MAG: hypothetical protein DHS80DRAFT_33896 [Piptocephalis tieghemiana]
MHLAFNVALVALLATVSSMALPSYGGHHSSPSYPDHGPSYLVRRAEDPRSPAESLVDQAGGAGGAATDAGGAAGALMKRADKPEDKPKPGDAAAATPPKA